MEFGKWEYVSILVILEIQSDQKQCQAWDYSCKKFQSLLSWKYNQIHVSAGVDWAEIAKSFNPCYLGNTIRSPLPMPPHPCDGCFNPCYLGNTIRSKQFKKNSKKESKFQSLLSWKYNQILFGQHRLKNIQKQVSILVILEIQSDLKNSIFDFLKVECFNPCYLGNTIRSHGWALSIIQRKCCFNPCYLGNTIRSTDCIVNSQAILCFNPCYLGNTIRSISFAKERDRKESFQSLLSWKYNQISFFPAFSNSNLWFQSLLSWKYNQISRSNRKKGWNYYVSILVILEIQSDLQVDDPSSISMFGFNPCYLGNTIRSRRRIR